MVRAALSAETSLREACDGTCLRRRGFTLIELLVAIGFKGVASSLASKVDAAALARQRLNDPAARDACAAAIKAFRNELDAQVLKTIDLDAALKLDALIGIECPDDGAF